MLGWREDGEDAVEKMRETITRQVPCSTLGVRLSLDTWLYRFCRRTGKSAETYYEFFA